ncbi:MAG TPA: alpha-amylase family glycosyl hydrolase, partial [Anaerolineales bacterium]|nr:alpha-amylase family glycosyl hydrolase [Anaerolineales bacterium]
RATFLVLVISILAACAPTTQSAPASTAEPTLTPAPTQDAETFPWWNETVFYEIFVRSFRDSDGDGIGDFNGITEKLDYLEDLGIKGLWLMPINPSPSYHGYDVTDYYAVNPDYGTMEDFKHLLEEARARDIKIIIDLVLNHTSTQHSWFEAALSAESEYHDWYVWSETDPGFRGPWGAQAWYRASNDLYYYAIFWDQMPDLNYDNPAVQEEAKKMAAFWLEEVGVDGFRLDAVRYLAEDEKLADAESTHAYLEEWGEYYRSVDPEAFTVGEAWTSNATVKEYVATNRELDAAFNFDLADQIIKGIHKDGTNASLRFTLQTTIRDFPEQDNANFITNHDINRVMSQFGGDLGKAKVAAGILLTAPGIPFIYYGEEIGMTGTKPDELIRTPMQWSDEEGAGFTEGIPWQAINSDYREVNVEAQTGDRDSLLEHYRNLIQLRNAHPAMQTGKTYVTDSSSNKLVSYLRASEDEALLVLINIDDVPVTDYELSLSTGNLSGSYNATSLLGDSTMESLQANPSGGFDGYTPLSEVPPYAVIVIQLTPLN